METRIEDRSAPGWPAPDAPGFPTPGRPGYGQGGYGATGPGGPWYPAPPPGPIGSPPPVPPRSSPVRATALAVALALVSAVAGAGLTRAFWPQPTPRTSSSVGTGSSGDGSSGNGATSPFSGGGLLPGNDGDAGGSSSSSGQGGPSDAAAIAAKIDPAVVDITTTLGYANAEAAGTGLVLTSSGEVLTNNHVISGATSINVTDVGNGRTYRAAVVGYDRSHDIAVLQLSGASGLAVAGIASTAAAVGDQVVGVGNAGGSGGTPSYAGGSITATDRSINATDSGDGTSEQLTGLLETDARIVAGDSGGPLVNRQGQVVGIDTAASAGFRFSSSAQGYAIPIAAAVRIADQIASGTGSATVHLGATAMMGVQVQAVPGNSGGSGALIAGVVSGGPAEAAGLVAGDVITAVDGHPVSSPDELSATMLTLTPGHTATVTYLDQSGRQATASVQLASGPAQ
jgi:S1-C subfamily serine protease